IYCAGGHRGNMAATLMRTLGYTNVRNMAGGFGAWSTAGLPFEGGAPAPAEDAAVAEFDPVALWTDYLAGLPASFNAVRVDDAAAQVEANPDLLIVDVRTVDEYAEGHIAGAINIPLTEVTDHLDMLPNLDEDAAVAEFDPVALWTDYLAGLPASFNAVRVDDAAAQVEANPDLLIVDVRTVDEYAEGHIAGAINIPLTEVTDHLDMLPNLD